MWYAPGYFEALVFLCFLGPICLMIFGCMIVSPFIARRKGYAPYYWFFALHPVGLIVIANLAPLSSAATPEERDRMEARANRIGGVLTGIALFASVSLTGFLALLLIV